MKVKDTNSQDTIHSEKDVNKPEKIEEMYGGDAEVATAYKNPTIFTEIS